MTANITVLTPNGRRQSVKVNPNTTLLQILEEVCTKQGFKADEHELRHHNKVIDTSAIIRFSGLPNNALLELTPATKTRNETNIVLGVQLEDGTRLTGSYSPAASLWGILLDLCPAECTSNSNLVVVYMRQEIYGLETLQGTTLRSLGLTSGRAMLRVIHRSPESLKTQANVSVPLPSKPTEEKPYKRTFIPVVPQEPPPQPQLSPRSSRRESNANQSSQNTEKNEIDRSLATKAKQESPPSKKKDSMVDMIKNEKKKQAESKPSKGAVGTKGKQHVQIDTKVHLEDEFVFLGDRNAMIFSLETAEAIPSEDLPDDFFDLTVEDARKLLRDVKRERLSYENGQLMTSAMRNLEESKKQLRQLHRYKKAIIRVQFPDRMVLQATFNPSDTIAIVSDFVKEYLECRNTDFYLYTTPPKTVLKKESNLLELGCIPGAILHFGLKSPSTCESILRRDLKDKFTSSSIASLAAARMREENIRGDPYYNDDAVERMELDSDVNVGASTSTAVDSYEDFEPKSATVIDQKVPKWFKPSK